MAAAFKPAVFRFYRGLPREDLIGLWASALRSGRYTQGTKVLHRPSYAQAGPGKINGAFCGLGVLCHVLELPRKIITTHDGLLFGYGDDVSSEPRIDNLPEQLMAFLVRPGRSKLTVNLGPMITEAPVLFAKIAFDTKLTREQLLRMETTLASLNDLGVSFGTLSHIVESNHW